VKSLVLEGGHGGVDQRHGVSFKSRGG